MLIVLIGFTYHIPFSDKNKQSHFMNYFNKSMDKGENTWIILSKDWVIRHL